MPVTCFLGFSDRAGERAGAGDSLIFRAMAGILERLGIYWEDTRRS